MNNAVRIRIYIKMKNDMMSERVWERSGSEMRGKILMLL